MDEYIISVILWTKSLLLLPYLFPIRSIFNCQQKAFYPGLSRSYTSDVYANKKTITTEVNSLSKKQLRKDRFDKAGH